MRVLCTILFFLCFSYNAFSQNIQSSDSLRTLEQFKKEIVNLRADIDNVQLNLGKSEKRFKTGIAVATLGYSITITGGLMLGRKRDDLGKVLLVAGGATGVTGTILMVDAFKFLGRASRKNRAER